MEPGPVTPPLPSHRREAPRLRFAVEDAGVVRHAVAPTLRFDVRVDAPAGTAIRSVALNVELRIAATRRPYDEPTQEKLGELFGEPSQWGRSLRTLHWATLPLQVPPFSDSTLAELHVPCTYDLHVTASAYLSALGDGVVPLEFLFSGTVFYADPDHGAPALQVARIDWNSEAEFSMPAALWQEMMDRYFPRSAWLRLDRDTFDRLRAYRARHKLPTWEATLETLLRAEREDAD